ncbi:hypothetical protein TNCV_4552021 [Trichonephila clavipes]|nr:hypothetical protein TNCV_4552021 [Trichonephila clavipes]
MPLNKSGVLAMSAEATTIRVMRSSSVVTGVSHISDFRWPQKKKLKGLRSGKRGGQATGPSHPIYLPGYIVSFQSLLCRTVGCVSLEIDRPHFSPHHLNVRLCHQDAAADVKTDSNLKVPCQGCMVDEASNITPM